MAQKRPQARVELRMIERTQKRLREAKFFYGRLVACKDLLGPYKNEPDAFEFYLDAFMQVARSVPWVLQSEEKKSTRLGIPHGKSN